MNYKTDEGEVIQGTSPLEIVTALRDGGRFTADETIDEFMEAFADRYWEFNERDIDFTTPEAFVADLLKVGYLTKV